MSGGYTGVFESGEGVTGYRYISGRQVLDEAVINGRLISRYRNCTGQVYPEMHFSEGMFSNLIERYPEADSFKLSVNGDNLRGGWQYENLEKRGNNKRQAYIKIPQLHRAGIS